MNKKQKTLFETWSRNSQKASTSNATTFSTFPCEETPKRKAPPSLPLFSPANQDVFQTISAPRSDPQLDSNGFDSEAGKTWIYPTNYPVREYQFSIVQEALFKNTLVILPTGLGKTFIAAVVMYNIYRWYPKGKVIFMAPTRPLVAQQVEACFKITGISKDDTTQMTGTNVPEERKRLWMRKRVFFLTPQVLSNDMARNICPASSIKCIVVDEAHKALGNHAYCQVIREMQSHTSHFRVLALTATPGSDTQAVKLVLSNLLISHVEMRAEDSDDVKQYTHTRDIEKIVVPLGDRLNNIKSRFLDIINIYLKRLTQRRAISSRNPASLSKFQVLKMREDFSQHPPDGINKFSYGLTMADFSLCISLYHAYELLLLHGARPFYNFLIGIINGEKSIPHARAELMKNCEFEELMDEVQENYVPDCNTDEQMNNGISTKRIYPGHPKLEKLLEVVMNHFKSENPGCERNTRVMIFSQYRDSVQEIMDLLNVHQPMIKCMSFIGQASKSSTSVGYSQKHQLKVLEQFRFGGYNTLVSTCVGEEGLDIGEVDLIVCYDCPKSPIRLVQRMGRTGRLRKGRIVILIGEGKEEKMYSSCEGKKKSVQRAISKGFPFGQIYNSSPSLVPHGTNPVCVKKVIIPEVVQTNVIKPKGRNSRSAFLTPEELSEFNLLYKVPKENSPLLPKSTFVSLKTANVAQEDDTAESGKDESKFCLSRWLLWQTRPQRIHKVTHSFRTLLLTTTAEQINFPTTVPGIDCIRETLQKPSDQPTMDCAIPPIIDTCKEKENCIDLIDLTEDAYVPFENVSKSNLLVPPLKTLDITGSISLPVTDHNSSRCVEGINPLAQGNLLFKLFGIKPKMARSNATVLDMAPPPVVEELLPIEDGLVLEVKPFAIKEKKIITALHILNKKMKARLKRKTKEIGVNIFATLSKKMFDASFITQSSSRFQSIQRHNVSPPSRIKTHTIDDLPKQSLTVSMTNAIVKNPPVSQYDDCFNFSPHKQSTVGNHISSPLNLNESVLLDNNIISFDISSPHKQWTVGNQISPPLNFNESALLDNNIISFDISSPHKQCIVDNQISSPLNLNESVILDKNIIPHDISSNSVVKRNIDLKEMQCLSPVKTKAVKSAALFDINNSPPRQTAGICDINVQNSPKALEFDISFDIFKSSSPFKEEMEELNLKRCASEKDSSLNSELSNECDVDKNVSLILDQFSSRCDNPSSTLTRPLKVKKIMFEKDYKKSHQKSKNNSESLENSVNLNEGISYASNVNNLQNLSGENLIGCQRTGESTQYSLTQMLSFIDCTDKFESLKNNTSNNATDDLLDQAVIFESSDEAIEPTPPKENGSKFLYRSNSLNQDSNSSHFCTTKDGSTGSNVNKKLLFDLSDFSSSEKKNGIQEGTTSTVKCEESPDCLDKLFFDISFDFAAGIVSNDTNLSCKANNAKDFPSQKSRVSKDHTHGNKHVDSKAFDQGEALPTNTCLDNKSVNESISANVPKVRSLELSSKKYCSIEKTINHLKSVEIKESGKSIECPKNAKKEAFRTKLTSNSHHSVAKNVDASAQNLSNAQCSSQSNYFKEKQEKTYVSEHSVLEGLGNSKSNLPTFKQPTSYKLSKKKLTTTSKENELETSLPNADLTLTANALCFNKKSSNSKKSIMKAGCSNQTEMEDFDFGKNKQYFNLMIPNDKGIREVKTPLQKENKNIRHKRNNFIEKKNDFILSQADASGSDSSEWEKDSIEDDCLEASFIDDVSIQNQSYNQKAMYLQSIKNCAGLPQKYKLKMNANPTNESFSYQQEDCSNYLMDSFCVGDNEVLFDSSAEEETLSKAKNVRPKNVTRKRKRIVALDDSSSSDDDGFVRKISTSARNAFSPLMNQKKVKSKVNTIPSTDEEFEMKGKSYISNNMKKDLNYRVNNQKVSNSAIYPERLSNQIENIETTTIETDFVNDNGFNLSFDINWDDMLGAHHSETEKSNSASNVAINITNATLDSKTAAPNFKDISSSKVSSEINIGHNTNTFKFNNSNVVETNIASTSHIAHSNGNRTQFNSHQDNKEETLSFCATSKGGDASKKPMILVDSRELAGGKPIISALRTKYGVNSVVMQLSTADYVLSNRLAVKRIMDSEFSVSTMPAKVVDKVKLMCDSYEKSFVIIQADCRKRVLGFAKPSTKYTQFSINLNFQPATRVLYSSSFEETSSILFDIIQKEQNKGFLIDVPVALNPSNQQLFEFYYSCPHMTPVCALRFVYHFPVVDMFLKSSVQELKKAGSISTQKAILILEYFKSELLFGAHV